VTTRLIERLLTRPDRNVGRSDFGTRVLASLALAFLVAIEIPQLHVKFSLIKICLLIGAELGLVSLMLGLFLRAKTYFSGLQLFSASLIMLWLERRQQPWAAVAVGVFFLALGIGNLLTRRSRLNQVLGISSLREIIVAATPLTSAKTPPGAPLHSLTDGGPR
jgi:hypothetical protein